MRKLKREECTVLPLVLKGKWFDMVALGRKKEEYRERSMYWRIRVVNLLAKAECEGLKMVVEFRRGYMKRAPRTAFLLDEILVRGVNRFLHPDWGEPQGDHFVLRLGERVMLEGGAE